MEKILYRVKKGETVISVAKKFKVSAIKIKEINQLKSEIEEGDIIEIESQERYYEIQLSDTIEKIMERNNIGEEEFTKKNGKIEYVFYGLIVNM